MLDLAAVEREAKELIAQENHAAAVQAAVLRLREEAGKSLWQRLLDKLPFTVTVQRRNT